MKLFLMSIFSYLLGAIPFGYIVVKIILRKDIRNLGSGNIGATNVSRLLGKKWGRLVLVLDILKGFIAVLLTGYVLRGNQFAIICSVICSILGHVFPIYIGFRGGKGVATAIGAFLGVSFFFKKLFLVLICAIGVWLCLYFLTGFVSIGSIGMAVAIIIGSLLLIKPIGIKICSIIVGLLILYRHRSNIERLWKGKEKKTEL